MLIDDNLRDLLTHYRPNAERLAEVKQAPFLAMVGITGAGKDSLISALLKEYPDYFYKMISFTTRMPRVNDGVLEKNDREYHFIDKPMVVEMLEKGEFIEAKIYANNIYGTSLTELKKAYVQGRVAIKDIEIQGACEYIDLGLNIKPVFLLPPDYQTWIRRLSGRHQDNLDELDLKLRLSAARHEIDEALDNHSFYIVINNDIKDSISLIYDIENGERVDPRYPKAIKTAEKLRNDIVEHLESL